MYVSDLIRIAAAGGGFRLDCSNKLVSDIIRIVSAAANGHSFIVLENCSNMPLSDRIRISAAGEGFVFFNDTI